VYVCESCFLVQLPQYVAPENIFTEYAYFSSYSDSWVEHARRYTEKIIERLGLTPSSHVVEVASNDGYLLQHFVARGIPVLGVEPAANIAKVAEKKNIPTRVCFFATDTAKQLAGEGRSADLIIGNNVLAQVPDLNDFVGGLQVLLKPNGVVTMEFPHLFRLIEDGQFDTIYHEHFSYFSFHTVEKIFCAHGLRLFDVEELPTHGGSLRIYGCHAGDRTKPTSDRALALHERERSAGVTDLRMYSTFSDKVKETKRKLLEALIGIKREGKSIAGYGAPGKGNTLLNYCGIGCDFLDYTVDRSAYKQGKFLPGTHVPILHPNRIAETRPDYVLILPWNIREEIMQQLSYIRDWHGRFIVPIPEVRIVA
jgi:SAM-dependent methyltransferase